MKVTASNYLDIKRTLIEEGYADEIDWQTNLKAVTEPNVFRDEAIWVILNSGMKEQIARIISNRIKDAWKKNQPTSSAFGHKGKVEAIDFLLKNYVDLFYQYAYSLNKLAFLEGLPYIGKITKYHLAKNLGVDCVKPDRHLVRIAKESAQGWKDCNEMCLEISKQTGDKICVVDIVLWRAANLGMI